MSTATLPAEEVRARLHEAFLSLDIIAEIERHCNTQLQPTSRSGRQYSGACPYPDCSADSDGFTAWPALTSRGSHFYCRGCRRSGDIIKLIREIKGLTFPQACDLLGIPNPYSRSGVAQQWKAPTQPRAPAVDPAATHELRRVQALYPRARAALCTYERARAYLAERAIPLELAEKVGLGYIPPMPELKQIKPETEPFYRMWCDRIIFPLSSRQGQGFTARALALWQPGMDEDEHKRLLKERNIPRYMTTYNAGYFHAEALTGAYVTFVEGPFDALALIAGGIIDAMATCGTSIDADFIPLHICDATLAYDNDEAGQRAAADWEKALRRKGIAIRRVASPEKDWSACYRLHGVEGLAPLLNMPDVELSTVGDKQANIVHDFVHTNADDASENRTETGQNVAYCCDETALAAQAGPPLCSPCLFAGVETEAVCFVDDFNYCAAHAPDRAGATITVPEGILDLWSRLLWHVRYAEERCERLALDLETTGLDFRTHKIISVALGVPGDVAVIDCRQYYGLPVEQQEHWRAALCKLFTLPVTWIGHNLKFDWAFLACQFGVRINRVYDTMLAEQLVLAGAQASKSLQATAERYGLEVKKEAREWFPGLDTRPAEWRAPFPAEQLEYIRQDIAAPCMVYARQQEHIERAGLARIVTLENEALPAIASMEVAGVRVDVEHWRAVLSAKQERQQQIEAQLRDVLGNALASQQQATQQAMFADVAPTAQINLSSSDQIRAALATLGVSLGTFRGEELEMHKGEHPVIELLLEWKDIQKITSSFGESVLKYVRGDGRIHADFGQIGAVSGRIITRDPNIQQMPRKDDDEGDDDIRACIIAAPGCKLVIADLPNIELRILAELSGDEKMLAAFASGEDLHSAIARLMLDLPASVNPKKHIINGVSARQIAKQINFGLNYGMGAGLLAARIGVDLETAKRYRARYQETYARATAWLRNIGRKVKVTGVVSTPAGRRRQFTPEQLQSYGAELSAKNHPIQGTNADILKRALALLHNRLPTGVQIVLTVHDEVVLEAPEALTEQAAQILKACMLEACQDFLKVVYVPEPDVLISDHWQKG
jgi:DNA polymerase-1